MLPFSGSKAEVEWNTSTQRLNAQLRPPAEQHQHTVYGLEVKVKEYNGECCGENYILETCKGTAYSNSPYN